MIESRDGMSNLVMECVMASLEEFKKDLERRLAAVMRMRSYPQAMVVNMAETVGEEIGEWLQGDIVASGRVRAAVKKLL